MYLLVIWLSAIVLRDFSVEILFWQEDSLWDIYSVHYVSLVGHLTFIFIGQCPFILDFKF